MNCEYIGLNVFIRTAFEFLSHRGMRKKVYIVDMNDIDTPYHLIKILRELNCKTYGACFLFIEGGAFSMSSVISPLIPASAPINYWKHQIFNCRTNGSKTISNLEEFLTFDHLTIKQKLIYRHLKESKTKRYIGRKMSITDKTFYSHRSKIAKALGFSSTRNFLVNLDKFYI